MSIVGTPTLCLVGERGEEEGGGVYSTVLFSFSHALFLKELSCPEKTYSRYSFFYCTGMSE